MSITAYSGIPLSLICSGNETYFPSGLLVLVCDVLTPMYTHVYMFTYIHMCIFKYENIQQNIQGFNILFRSTVRRSKIKEVVLMYEMELLQCLISTMSAKTQGTKKRLQMYPVSWFDKEKYLSYVYI